MKDALTQKAIALLKTLIATPSFSGEEDKTADAIGDWLKSLDIPYERINNNIIAKNQHWENGKPVLLLNSHHDTVRPNQAYTREPFDPAVEDGKLYGLGSNDAGGCLVSLLATFAYFHKKKQLNHNILMVASMEEENAGPNSLRGLLPNLPHIDVAIVGEPTLMDLAIAEKGSWSLMPWSKVRLRMPHIPMRTMPFIRPWKPSNGSGTIALKNVRRVWGT